MQTAVPGQLDFNPERCSWEDMLQELERAKAESDAKGDGIAHKLWRGVGTAATVLGPGLDALPDEVCVLKGGLAVIFSVSDKTTWFKLCFTRYWKLNIPSWLDNVNRLGLRSSTHSPIFLT